jgi:hypothetical protein
MDQLRGVYCFKLFFGELNLLIYDPKLILEEGDFMLGVLIFL